MERAAPPDRPDPGFPPARPDPGAPTGRPAGQPTGRGAGAQAGRPDQGEPAPAERPAGAASEQALAAELVVRFEQLVRLVRSLSPPSGLSLTAAAALGTLERSGPRRLTALAAREGVTQPAMTQLIARLEQAGLVRRAPDSADGRVVEVHITPEGAALLARRRAVRAERLAGILADLDPRQQAALAAALPVMDVLVSASSEEPAARGNGASR